MCGQCDEFDKRDNDEAEKAAQDAIVIDAEDVSVRQLDPDECECGEPATHAVWVELRAIGTSSVVLTACKTCAVECADKIRRSIRPMSNR